MRHQGLGLRGAAECALPAFLAPTETGPYREPRCYAIKLGLLPLLRRWTCVRLSPWRLRANPAANVA